jgi:RNAse (barnase) inhibitor barstar
MQMVVDQPNGRIELVTKIKKHLEYVDSFPELYQAASEFHRELATMFMVDTIITTNWDCIFERECAAQPFVNDADMAFWDAVERRVELLPVRLTPA